MISFDSTLLVFTVDKTLISTSVTYILKVIGALNSPGPSSFVPFNVVLTGCDATSIATTSESDQTYRVDTGTQPFTITAFTESMGVCGTFTYSSI
jgi:hypothetical protein